MKTPDSLNLRLTGSPGCPSMLDLASYLDGRAGDDQRDGIELHLAQCPVCLQLVREYRQEDFGVVDSAVTAPLPVIARAMDLVSEDAMHVPSPTRSAVPWIMVLRRGAAVAASVAIGLFGYQVGAGMSASASAESAAADELFFGLVESSDQQQSVQELFTFDIGEAS